MPHVKRQKIQQKLRVTITAFLLIAGFFVAVNFSQAAVGLQVGTSTLILNSGENLMYGNISASSNAASNLLLLQNASLSKFLITSSGNVGIGANSINDIFSIGNGTTAAPAGSSNTGHNFTSTYLSTDDYALTNYGVVKTLIGSATSGAALWGGTVGSNIWSLNGTNNVGIGVTNPLTKFHLVGSPALNNTTTQSLLRLERPLNAGVSFAQGVDLSVGRGNTYPSTQLRFILDNGTNSFSNPQATVMTLDSGGNVGIGTTTPIQKLDVAGNQNLSGTLILGNPVPAQNGVNIQNLTLTSDPFTSLAIMGYDYDMLVNADKKYTINLTGAFAGGNAAALFDGNTGSSLIGTAGNTGTIEVDLGNMQHYFYGLVLTSPWGSGYGFSTSFLIEKYYDPSSSNGWDGNCDNSEGDLVWATVADVTGFSGRQFVTRSNLGNGICKLRVTFRDFSGTTSQIQVGDLSAYQFYYGYKGLNAKTNGDTLFGDYDFSDGTLRVHIDNSTGITYFNGGNVGVGTVSPNDKFSIGNSGTAPAGSSNTGHNYTSTYLASDDYALANYGIVKTLIGSATGSLLSLWSGTVNGNIWNGAAGLGNVGIGTTTPGAKLDVVGTAKIGGILFNDSVKNDESIYFSSQSYIEAGTLPPVNTLSNLGVVSYASLNSTSSPFSKVMLFNGYSEGKMSDYIPVQAGETLYAEIWAMRNVGSTGTAGTLYYGISKYDKDKRLVEANEGLTYFPGSGATVPQTGVWTKYSGTYTLPTSHTPYLGSDGGPVRYVRYYIIVDYNAGTIPTYVGGMLLRRQSVFRDSGSASFNGNVGIGLINPTSNLYVRGGSQTDLASLTLDNTEAAAGQLTTILFNNSSPGFTGKSAIKSELLSGATGTNLHFYTSAAGVLTDRLTILSGGSVGVGTTAPKGRLNVLALANIPNMTLGAATQPGLSITSSDSGQYGMYFGVNSNGNSWIQGGRTDSATAYNISLQASGGNVGIGTTVPNDIFSIGNAGSAPAGSSNTGHNYTSTYLNSDDYALANYGIVKTLIGSATGSILSLWSGTVNGNIWNGAAGAGNVGIGTTNPLTKLDINGGSWTANGGQLRVSSADSVGTALTLVNTDTGGRNWSFLSTGSSALGGAGLFSFYDQTTGGTAGYRMVINPSGNIGIGTTNPVGKLQVQYEAATEGIPTMPNYLTSIFIRNTSSAYANEVTYIGGSNAWTGLNFGDKDAYNIGSILYYNSDNSLRLSVNSGERMRINSSGNIGVGTTGPGYRLDVQDSTIATPVARFFATGSANNYGPNVIIRNNDASIYAWSGIDFQNAAGSVVAEVGGTGSTYNNPSYPALTANGTFFLSKNNYGMVAETGDFLFQTGIGVNTIKAVIKNGGNVGIGTTAPNDIFSIGNTGSAPAGSLNTGHNFTSTYLSTDDYALANTGYVKSLIAAATSTIATSTAVTSIFVTATTSAGSLAYTGGYVGYDAGNKICNSVQTGSHFCRTDEIVYLIQLNGSASFSSINGQDAWIADGPPGYTGVVSADDCGGWVDSTNNKLGHFWIFASSGGGRGSLSSCDTIKKITCCK